MLAWILAVIAGGALGFTLELGLFRPLRRRRTGNVSLIVVTIGLSLVLSNLFLIMVGGRPLQYAEYVMQTQVGPGPFQLRPRTGSSSAWDRDPGHGRPAAAAHPVWHRAARGIGQSRPGGIVGHRRRAGDSGDLVGGAALAATGGVFLGLATAVEWDMGLEMLLLLFAAVVLGGIGTVYGAVLGALLIGIVTQVSTYWMNPEAKNAVAFVVLIAVLLVRPQGILGRRETDRMINALQDAIAAGIGLQAAAFALAAVGLNLQFGYTGLLNFGLVAFIMVGAYGTAITVDQGGPLWLGLIVGVLASVILGLIFGLPTLRLRADYLAIVTITAGETLRIIVNAGGENSLTRGPFGIQEFARSFFDINPIPTAPTAPAGSRSRPPTCG